MVFLNLIGDISEEKAEYKIEDDEIFYESSLSANTETGTVVVPIVYSEYLSAKAQGHSLIEGYIKSERVSGKIHTYIYVMSVHPTKAEDNMHAQIIGKVASIKEVYPTKRGVEVLPIIVSYKLENGVVTLVHCKAYGKTARLLSSQNITKGDMINIDGELRSKGNCISVQIQSVFVS